MARVYLALVVTLLLCNTSEARADGNAEAAAATKKSIEKDPIKDPPPSDFKHVSVTLNPLSLLLTRFGANIEYLPARHHGFILNPYLATGSASQEVDGHKLDTKLTGFGGELGYRFYSGTEGANGVFIGPSMILQRSHLETKVDGGPAQPINVFMYGGALDIGGQLITNSGFTIGAGAGVGYLFVDAKNVASSRSVRAEGVFPRILLTVGYSF